MPDPTTTDDARDAAVAALIDLRTVGAQIFDAAADAQTLAPHHLFALRAVADGARSLNDVARATDRHVSSVSRTVDQLVGEGLLLRAEDPDDRRQVVLRPTERGGELAGRFARVEAALMHRVMGHLTRDEAAAAARLVHRIAEAGRALLAQLEEDPGALELDLF